MIDTHCHILWGVDDASKEKSQALDMCRIAVLKGTTTIVATSHIKPPYYANTLDILQNAVKQLQDALEVEDLDLEIVIGAENFVSHKTIHLLEEDGFVSYGNQNKYILIEFAWTKNLKDNPTAFIMKFIEKGFIPVIAHPERYEWVHDDYTLLKKWRDLGALLQINRTSILGLDKIRKANEVAKAMLDDDLVDIIASDAHTSYSPRYPNLEDIYKYIQEYYGKAKAKQYLIDTPKKIISK